MKFQKINEQQVRCILTQNDLNDRHIEMSELAYGSEKTRQLFLDMMEQANREVGFDADDAPLIVEAIPMAGGNLMLIITKADNPDEMDPRFARFAPAPFPEGSQGQAVQAPVLPTLQEATPEEAASPLGLVRIYRFPTLDSVSVAAAALKDVYFGINSLYKDPEYKDYYLTVTKSGHSLEEFNRTCNILSEYASRVSGDLAVEGFLDEHFEQLIKNRAVQVMAML